MSIIDKVKAKLEEYGLEIYNDYQASKDEYVFYVEDMIVFVDTKDNTVAVSFQAAVRPDKAANIVLILAELKLNIDVMESFIFDRNNKCLTGEKAFDLINKSKQSETIQDFIRNQAYREILISAKCHEC